MKRVGENNAWLGERGAVGPNPRSLFRPPTISRRQPLIFSVPSAQDEQNHTGEAKAIARVQIYSPGASRDCIFSLLPLLVHILLSISFLSPSLGQALLTLYTSICYAAALCASLRGRRFYTAAFFHFPPPYIYPQTIFDQYYKNQPTDFLREILPPSAPEYFITVHRIRIRCFLRDLVLPLATFLFRSLIVPFSLFISLFNLFHSSHSL